MFPFIELVRVTASAKVAPVVVRSKSVWATLAPVLASAFCVAALMYPLDLVRALQMANVNAGMKLTTLQLLSNFRKAHGLTGFFTQGLAPELVRSTWMRFVKFSLFPIIHRGITGGIDEKKGTSLTKALSAILTSIPENFTIMPFEIAKIALQLDNQNRFNNNMISAMSILAAERGLSVFTLGYLGVQLRLTLWSVGYFTTIPIFQRNIEAAITKLSGPNFKLKEHPGLNVACTVFSGFLAGVFGGLLNTPSDAIRTIIQKNVLTQPVGTVLNANTFIAVGQEIVRKRGYGGLYAGILFKSLHLGGGGALMAFFLPFFDSIINKHLYSVPAPIAADITGANGIVIKTSKVADKKK